MKDLSKEKWILLHKIPKEDILEFIVNHHLEWFTRKMNEIAMQGKNDLLEWNELFYFYR